MIADPNPSPARRPPRHTASIVCVLWIVKVLGAGLLAYASYGKMTDAPMAMKMFEDLGMEPQGRYVIGGLEGLAALAMLIPQSAVYGAFLGFGIMCGAVIAHVTVIGFPGIQLALLVAACCAVVIYIRRHEAPFLENLLDH